MIDGSVGNEARVITEHCGTTDCCSITEYCAIMKQLSITFPRDLSVLTIKLASEEQDRF